MMKKLILILFLFSHAFMQIAPFFDGNQAYEYLLKQCSFGARNPGSDGHLNFKYYLVEFL